MPKRNTKSNMQSKDKHQRAESQQLSPRDIQRSEAAYRKEFNDFMLTVAQGEKYKKNTIKKLARLLEEAGTVETHKISTRIKDDLKRMQEEKKLEAPLIELTYVSKVLEDKYKRSSGYTKQKEDKNDDPKSNFTFQQTETVTTPSIQQTPEPQPVIGPVQFTEPPRQSPQAIKEEVDFGEWVNSLYNITRSLAEEITGYNEDKILKVEDILQLVSETRSYRFDITKRLTDLDLRTLHRESRRSILLLNDFIKHIETELDSRKNKQGLISE